MKNTCFLVFLLAIGFSATAQTRLLDYNTHSLNIWKGGQPGQEANWHVAANWSLQRIPDWTHDVLSPICPLRLGLTRFCKMVWQK